MAERSDGRVVRPSVSGAVDSGLIPIQLKQMTLQNAQHKRKSEENKPASLLVVPLGMALSGIPPFWCDK